jgi:hypothetical protein
MYQHIREAKKKYDTQALDAATKVSCWTVPTKNFVLHLQETF